MTHTTVMASMDPDLLLNLIDLGEIQSVSSIASCNDDAVIKYLQGTQDENPQLTAEDLEREVKAKVQYRLSENNTELRVTSAVGDLLALLRRINMQNVIKDNPKKSIKLLVTILQPSGFKKLIESDLALHKVHLKADWSEFIKHIKQEAVAFDRYATKSASKASQNKTDLNRTTNTYGGSGGNGPGGNKTSGAGNKITGSYKTGGKPEGPYASAMQSKQNTARDTGEKKNTPSCLNTIKCPDKRHWLKDCPNNTPEEAVTLKADMRSKKRNGAPKIAVVSTKIGSSQTAMLRTRIGGLTMDALADTGADHSAISRMNVDRVIANGFPVEIKELESPIVL
jgi:hypothetical protein